jgi:preprotein translocase subunit SecD
LTVEIREARAGHDQRTGQPVLNIALAKPSADALGRLTRENVGREMQLRIVGEAVLTKVIREPILGGGFQISGITTDEAEFIAAKLQKGGSKVEVVIAPN